MLFAVVIISFPDKSRRTVGILEHSLCSYNIDTRGLANELRSLGVNDSLLSSP